MGKEMTSIKTSKKKSEMRSDVTILAISNDNNNTNNSGYNTLIITITTTVSIITMIIAIAIIVYAHLNNAHYPEVEPVPYVPKGPQQSFSKTAGQVLQIPKGDGCCYCYCHSYCYCYCNCYCYCYCYC